MYRRVNLRPGLRAREAEVPACSGLILGLPIEWDEPCAVARSSVFATHAQYNGSAFEALQSKKPFDSDMFGEFEQCIEILVFA